MRIHTVCVRLLTSAVILMGLASHSHALTLGQIAQQTKAAETGPFGAVEMVAAKAADRVGQWNQALAAMRAEAPLFASCLQAADHCKGAAMTAWRDMVLTLLQADKVTQLRLVNTFFNRWQYREDKEVYGVSDKWATPAQFMANSGDCEDYAIAKYFTLSVLGFNDRDLRVMAVIDNSRGIGHSVLAAKADGVIYVLDNLSSSVQKDTDYANAYTPRFAVNASGIWSYGANPVGGLMLASAK
ncbi:MAG TPA: transglutaminase-like cysteine peptidase [Methylophilus sp.]